MIKRMELTNDSLKRRFQEDLDRCKLSLSGVHPYSSMYEKWITCAEISSLKSIISDCKLNRVKPPGWVGRRLQKVEASNDWLS